MKNIYSGVRIVFLRWKLPRKVLIKIKTRWNAREMKKGRMKFCCLNKMCRGPSWDNRLIVLRINPEGGGGWGWVNGGCEGGGKTGGRRNSWAYSSLRVYLLIDNRELIGLKRESVEPCNERTPDLRFHGNVAIFDVYIHPNKYKFILCIFSVTIIVLFIY